MAEQRFQFISPASQRLQVGRTPEHRTTGVGELRGSVMGGGAQGVRAVRGGITQRAELDSTTLEAFQALSNGIIDPYIERRQQQEYMEGARRQIEGEALKDIVDSQPWYSKIFGPSASVSGARTMASMQAVEGFTNSIASDMGNLRQLTPEEFGAEVMNRMDQSADLGDTQTNVAVQAQLMESYGPLVRSHTKEHAKYVQEEMQAQFTGSLATEARSLGQYMQGVVNGTVSEDDARIVISNAAGALQPIEGQAPESYWSGVEVATEEAMATGNFHFVNLVESQLYEHMPAEQRVKFQNDRRKYERQVMSDRLISDHSVELAQLSAQSAEGLISPQETMNRINALNTRFSQQTGIDREMINASTAEGLITSNLRGLISEQKARAKAAREEQEKLDLIAAKTDFMRTAFATGQAQLAIDQGADRSEVQSAAMGQVAQLQALGREEGTNVPQDAWAQVVVQAHTREGFKVDGVARRIQHGARVSVGNSWNPAFESAYQDWKTIRNLPNGGRGVAADYAGEYNSQFEQYDQYLQAGTIDPASAFELTFSDHPSRQAASSESIEEYEDFLDSELQPGWFRRAFGEQELTDSSKAIVARTFAAVAGDIEQGNPGLSIEDRAEMAFAMSKSSLDIVNGHAIIQEANSGVRMSNYLGRTPEETSLIFDEVMQNKFSLSGVENPSSIQVQRLVDRTNEEGEKVPSYMMMVFDEGGFKPIVITGEELAEQALKPRRRRDITIEQEYDWQGNPQ